MATLSSRDLTRSQFPKIHGFKIHGFKNPWFTSKLWYLRRKTNSARRTFKRERSDRTYQTWQRLKLSYNHQIKKAKEEWVKKGIEGKLPLIYKTHIVAKGLISTYGNNLVESVKKRDQIAIESFKYLAEKTKNLSF